MMNAKNRSARKLKKQLQLLLSQQNFKTALAIINEIPAREVVSPLFNFFYDADELIKWRAVTAIGVVVANLAERDMEAARTVMRRLMWSLNDESGGIGWGAPEAMGEIMTRHRGLAEEYAFTLVSYIRKDGNYIEYELLQRGVLWGLGRVSQVHPDLVQDAADFLADYLVSTDHTVRGLAAWICGILQINPLQAKLKKLVTDEAEVTLFCNGQMVTHKVGRFAADALAALNRSAGRA